MSVMYVGHRGSKLGKGVENTMVAFKEGVALGYKALETDVHITKDNVYVVMHDDTFERITENSPVKSSQNINEVNYDEVKDLELSELFNGVLKTGCKICLFDDYLDLCKENNIIPVIEIKATNGMLAKIQDPEHYDYSNIEAFIQKIKDHGLLDKCIIISFMLGCLENIRASYPDVKLQWLCMGWAKVYLDRCANQNIDLDIYYGNLDDEIMNYCKKHNMVVNIWTLDDESKLQTYLDMGVDMITTNVITPR